MKKLLSILSIITLSVMLFAQAPQSFSYQTVIRDASWTALNNQLVGIKISILEDFATGTVVYEESHSTTTSQIGLVNLSVGEGTLMSGVFNTIDWGNHNYFIEVAVDVTGGTTYNVMGTTQLRSVPYALYAETSGTPGATGPQGIAGADGADGVDGVDGMDVLGAVAQTLYHNGIDWIATSNLSNNGINATTDADMTINEITVGKGGGNIISNTASGFHALYSNTTGDMNTANGRSALGDNTIGEENTANGFFSLKDNLTGNFNTANGRSALETNTTGNRNTASGAGALAATSGSNNTAIGYNAQTPFANGNNQVRIGDEFVTYAGVQVAWTITSDKHWKSDIKNSNLGLNFISKLRPVSYYRNNDENKKIEYGFIAQELEKTLNNAGASNNGIISKDDEGMYGVRYNDLMAPMVKAIQEQQEMINILQQENKEFKERIVELENK